MEARLGLQGGAGGPVGRGGAGRGGWGGLAGWRTESKGCSVSEQKPTRARSESSSDAL